jgi:hypothetical protein
VAAKICDYGIAKELSFKYPSLKFDCSGLLMVISSQKSEAHFWAVLMEFLGKSLHLLPQ